MRTLRSRLSYANVISTLCLFMLLGGGAYAATQLPKNSVGAKQLKNGAVTGQKIKQGTIDASKLTPGVLARPANAQGPQGERGAEGPQGSRGVAGDPGSYATVLASNPPEFLGAHPGFAAVERFPATTEAEEGTYCLAPEAGTSIANPIASPDGKNSSGVAFFIDAYANEEVVNCQPGQLEVHTYEMQEEGGGESGTPFVPLPSYDASFTVFAPEAQPIP
jgi:hypothetical protein